MLYRPPTAAVENQAAQLLGVTVTAADEGIRAAVAQADIRQMVKALYAEFAKRGVDQL